MAQSDEPINLGGFTLDADAEDVNPTTRLTFDMDPATNNKDLKEVKTLKSFLSSLTLGKARLESTFTPPPARFPVNEKTEETVEERNKAYETSFKPSPAKNDLKQSVSVGQTQDPALLDGHNLLSDIKPTSILNPLGSKSTVVTRRYTNTVLSQNRFTSADRMITDVDVSNPANSYNPSLNMTSRTPGEYDKSSEDLYKQRRLAHIGTILSARATGEIGSTQNAYNPDDSGAIAKALLPSSVQLAVDRVELKNLDVKDILRELTSEDVSAENFDPSPNKSWGQLNNPLDPYSGLSAVGMIALSLALVGATIVAFQVFVEIFKTFPIKGEGPNAAKHPDGRYVFGEYSAKLEGKKSGLGALLGKMTPSLVKLLGIRPTENPYDDALQMGVYTFFGLEPPSGGLLNTVVNSAIGTLNTSVETPGFNVIAARNIARSVVLLGDKLKEVGRSANVISGVQNVLSLLEEVRDSKLIAAMNVFAMLGDAILMGDKDVVETLDGAREYRSEIDSIPQDSPQASISKSKDKTGRLAWAGYRSPTALLIPSSIVGYTVGASVSKDIEAPNPLSILQNARTRTEYVSVDIAKDADAIGGGAKLDTTWVDYIESKLDSEYMPFYFHDLRTNEIVGFHAFLTDLSDSYAPAWESADGYGRVDPVKIYKSTERSITLSFWIAALNHDDHAEMWTKINKLVTLVYPQYSRGRTLKTEKYQFIQPFSQLITSSPLIRLRIGDVIRSNYSKFNLSRLFGAGDSSTDITMDGTSQGLVSSANIRKFQEAVTAAKNSLDPKYTYVLKHDKQTMAENNPGITISIPIVSSNNKRKNQNAKIPARYWPYIKVTKVPGPITLGDPLASSTATLSAFTAAEATELYGEIEGVTELAQEVKDFLKYVGNHPFQIRPEEVELTSKSAKQIAIDSGLIPVAENGDFISKLAQFLSPEQNAIVRAFDSTKGKGLGGVITSLNFNWMNQTTWEITPQRKAPMMCKVDINFAPIHDISPGIDHMGYNRAPVYPVAAQFSEPPVSTNVKNPREA